MLSERSKQLVTLALAEDVGKGDITTAGLIAPEAKGTARLFAKQATVVCGNEIAREVFARCSSEIQYSLKQKDGSLVRAGEDFATVSGSLGAIITAERTALNFLQRLSGISTYTRKLVDALEGSGVAVLDTRKTTPGFRELEKYAVQTGGGVNHRIGLFDAVLVKNNHIDALTGALDVAIRRLRSKIIPGTMVEVEVRTMKELESILPARPDWILLDNMNPEQIREAIDFVRVKKQVREIKFEASGGISLENAADYRIPGLNAISSGALTHSAPAAEISLHVVSAGAR